MIAYDGTNYLIVWADNCYTSGSILMGRFFNTSGVPVNNVFTIFTSLSGKVPFIGMPTFGNNNLLIVTTRVNPVSFTTGVVYGKIIQSSTTGINEDGINLTPKMFSLSQNYPNPFNPSTSISFSLSSRAFVSLKVFDLLGREVATFACGEMLAGSYSRIWNANNMPSGIYFCRLQAGSFTETKKLLLLR